MNWVPHVFLGSVSVVITAMLLEACASRQPPAPRDTNSVVLRKSDVVLVLPFRDGSCLPVYGNHVMCHLTGEHLDAGDVPTGTGIIFGSILSDKLLARHVRVIPYERALDGVDAADPDAVDRYEQSLGTDLGKSTGATKVLMGIIGRYDERSGTRLASGEPAAVAFSLALIDVSSGAMVYRTRFNRRQAPLSGNLFSLPLWWQDGPGWWTRREVAERALEEAADALTGRAGRLGTWTNTSTEGPTWRDDEPETSPIGEHY